MHELRGNGPPVVAVPGQTKRHQQPSSPFRLWTTKALTIQFGRRTMELLVAMGQSLAECRLAGGGQLDLLETSHQARIGRRSSLLLEKFLKVFVRETNLSSNFETTK